MSLRSLRRRSGGMPMEVKSEAEARKVKKEDRMSKSPASR